jgi:co-chaperonin GroES (HSP10)
MKKRESPIRTLQHPYDGNGAGYVPIDTKVLVLPDYIDETSEGGIVLTVDTVQQNELAITEGLLIGYGDEAFKDWHESASLEPGIRIVWAIYAGQMLEGDDGKMYRLINDTDIAAIRK